MIFGLICVDGVLMKVIFRFIIMANEGYQFAHDGMNSIISLKIWVYRRKE